MARYIFFIYFLMFGNFSYSEELNLPPFDVQIMAGHSPLSGVFGSLRLTKEFQVTDRLFIGPTFDYAQAVGADIKKSSLGLSSSFRIAKPGESSLFIHQAIFASYEPSSTFGYKNSRSYISGSTGFSALMFESYGVQWGPKLEYFYSLKGKFNDSNAILLGLVFSF